MDTIGEVLLWVDVSQGEDNTCYVYGFWLENGGYVITRTVWDVAEPLARAAEARDDG